LSIGSSTRNYSNVTTVDLDLEAEHNYNTNMNVMMDGVMASGSGRVTAPLLDLSKLAVAEPEQSQPIVRHVLDLRQPMPAMTQAPVLAQAVAATPIPHRRPLPPISWLVTGSAAAILLVGSVITIPRIIQKAENAKTATASAATETAATSANTPDATEIAAALVAEDRALVQTVSQFVASAGAPTFIVVKDLKTGAVSTNASDTPLTSASLYKLFVAHGIYSMIDNGKLKLTDRVPGTSSSVNECLTAMITVSDNTCGEALQAVLGVEQYDTALHQYGFSHTSFGASPNATSAGDVALLLERLYNGTLLGPSSSEQFLGLLKAQRVNNRLPQGLPAGTTIAHKTGDLGNFTHDAGIVYGPKTNYLVVLMSGPWNNVNAAPAKFAELSQKLYAQLNQ
jgi:beta-lactamase class A